MKGSGIYIIRNTVTGKVYVGSSLNINRRWTQHKCALKTNSHHSPGLQQAWSEDGAGSFEWGTIEETSNLAEREQYFLDLYKSYESENGYNGMRFAECRIDSPENKTVHLSQKDLADPPVIYNMKLKNKRMHIRLDKESKRLFEIFCERNKITPSKRMRLLIEQDIKEAKAEQANPSP